jgi:hypothetical protein
VTSDRKSRHAPGSILLRCGVAAALLAAAAPAAAQGVVCCNQLIDVKGGWVGAGRRCNMEGLSQGQRAMVCEKLGKAGITCDAVEPYCAKCDKEAIAKARADYERLLKTYQEIRAAADDMGMRAQEVVRQGEKIWSDYFFGLGRKTMTKVLTKPLPDAAKRGLSGYSAAKSPESALKEGVSLLKELSTKLKGGAWKRAAPIADIVSMFLDLGIANAKLLTLIGEFDRYAKEANKTAEAALDALKKARAARERLERLEALCREAAKAPAKKDGEEEDRFTPSGQRELEAAVALRDSWRRVGDMYEDSRGNLHSGDSARQEALAIVQKRSSGVEEGPLRRLWLALGVVAEAHAADSPLEIKAGDLMSEGSGKVARGLEVYQYVLDEMEGIVKIGKTRSSGTAAKPAGR